MHISYHCGEEKLYVTVDSGFSIFVCGCCLLGGFTVTRHSSTLFISPDSCLYVCLIAYPLSFAVRLHDSISEEGFHYLVFDLWVAFVHAHTHAQWHFIHACDCGSFVYANNFSLSCPRHPVSVCLSFLLLLFLSFLPALPLPGWQEESCLKTL